MGTKMAPSYANVFMGRLERRLLQSVILKPFSWLRFIDDIDMKWIHGRETIEAFLETANRFHPTIRHTAEVSNDKHVFLDTMSHLADDKVAVDLYTKSNRKAMNRNWSNQKAYSALKTTGVIQKILPVLSTETLLHIWLSTEYYGFRPSSTAVDTGDTWG